MALTFAFLQLSTELIVFLFHLSYSSDAVLYCWHGNIEDQSSLQNETCATGKISLPNIRDLVVSTTESPPPQNMTKVTAEAAVSITSVSQCMVFKYMKHMELVTVDGHKTYETSVYANYSCDHADLCRNSDNGWHINVSYFGIHGDVYCCNSNNCNYGIHGVPPQMQLCYQATNETQPPSGQVVSCSVSGAVCARTTKTNFVNGIQTQTFFCDETNRCKSAGLKQTIGNCKQISKDSSNNTEELCCCSKNKCFVPSWLSRDPPSHNTSDLDPSLQWAIAGSIILVTFLVGVGAGVAVAYVKSRKVSRGDNHMALTYRRIDAEEAGSHCDEEHLIT